MRLLLRHLTLFLTTVMVVTACNKEPQTNITAPNDDEKIFVFTNKQIKHTELSLDIIPHDQEAEYVVLFAEKKHFIANGIDTREELIEDDLAMLRNYAEYYGITGDKECSTGLPIIIHLFSLFYSNFCINYDIIFLDSR